MASRPGPRHTTPAPTLLLTCEHGGNLVPDDLAALARGHERLLASHRGHDPGALELAGRLAVALRAPLRFALVSRLLVDLNRSPDSPDLFSELTRDAAPALRRQILNRHYRPYRREVTAAVRSALRRSAHPVLHVSVHTFTPVLRGVRRDVDIGLLFDPARPLERAIVSAWERSLRAALPRLRIRRNAPYKGTDDGLTTHLRTLTDPGRYAGIELEVNQRFPRRAGPAWERTMSAIADSLRSILDHPAA